MPLNIEQKALAIEGKCPHKFEVILIQQNFIESIANVLLLFAILMIQKTDKYSIGQNFKELSSKSLGGIIQPFSGSECPLGLKVSYFLWINDLFDENRKINRTLFTKKQVVDGSKCPYGFKVGSLVIDLIWKH